MDPISSEPRILALIDPVTETASGSLALGSAEDVDRAVRAARLAFPAWSRTSASERADLLQSLLEEYRRRYNDVADAITAEMGAPGGLARGAQAGIGISHLEAAIDALGSYSFEEVRGSTKVVREPIGVCGLITPWNWPINQIVCKVAPALACGCTMVLKPSEIAPYSAVIWAEICAAAGVPRGVFNLVAGDGPIVGTAIAAHPDIDMVSFTGSTRAGIEVARAAALTVKRVHQELGGKSAHIVLDDERFEEGVRWGVAAIGLNAGQNCNAPTRMLVPRIRLDDAATIAAQVADELTVGAPALNPDIGPVVSETHWRRIQELLEVGIKEGATIAAGGLGRPPLLGSGYFVRPTIFRDVDNSMRIAQEEVFGPVLVIIAYDDLEDAVLIANDSPYGLAAYVSGADQRQLRCLASQLRAGQIVINGAAPDFAAPFGGYKRSGNGREWGCHAFAEFLETKAMLGFIAKS
ncbi:aldehyde dehydrogenase family protein [Sphingomonas sp. UYAg733]